VPDHLLLTYYIPREEGNLWFGEERRGTLHDSIGLATTVHTNTVVKSTMRERLLYACAAAVVVSATFQYGRLVTIALRR